MVAALILSMIINVATQQHLQLQEDSDLIPEWPIVDGAASGRGSTSGLTMRLLLQSPSHTIQERARRSPSPIYTGYFPTRSRGASKSTVEGIDVVAAAVPNNKPANGGRILHGTSSGLDELEGIIPNDEEILQTSAQSTQGQSRLPGVRRRLGYSGTVSDGKSRYVTRYNQGVPVYGAGEPYYFSYTHNFPIGVEDFENLVNSHNLPKKYKFTGSLDVTGLLEH